MNKGREYYRSNSCVWKLEDQQESGSLLNEKPAQEVQISSKRKSTVLATNDSKLDLSRNYQDLQESQKGRENTDGQLSSQLGFIIKNSKSQKRIRGSSAFQRKAEKYEDHDSSPFNVCYNTPQKTFNQDQISSHDIGRFKSQLSIYQVNLEAQRAKEKASHHKISKQPPFIQRIQSSSKIIVKNRTETNFNQTKQVEDEKLEEPQMREKEMSKGAVSPEQKINLRNTMDIIKKNHEMILQPLVKQTSASPQQNKGQSNQINQFILPFDINQDSLKLKLKQQSELNQTQKEEINQLKKQIQEQKEKNQELQAKTNMRKCNLEYILKEMNKLIQKEEKDEICGVAMNIQLQAENSYLKEKLQNMELERKNKEQNIEQLEQLQQTIDDMKNQFSEQLTQIALQPKIIECKKVCCQEEKKEVNNVEKKEVTDIFQLFSLHLMKKKIDLQQFQTNLSSLFDNAISINLLSKIFAQMNCDFAYPNQDLQFARYLIEERTDSFFYFDENASASIEQVVNGLKDLNDDYNLIDLEILEVDHNRVLMFFEKSWNEFCTQAKMQDIEEKNSLSITQINEILREIGQENDKLSECEIKFVKQKIFDNTMSMENIELNSILSYLKNEESDKDNEVNQ